MQFKARFPIADDIAGGRVSVSEIERIYDHIIDDESRYIFINRLNYSFTKDSEYILNIIRNTSVFRELIRDIEDADTIYGAGKRAQWLLDVAQRLNFKRIIDKNKTGELQGIPVIHPDDFMEKDAGKMIVSIRENAEEVIAGFDERRIEYVLLNTYFDRIKEDIYYDNKIVHRDMRGGVVLDVGCYDGKDSMRAIRDLDNVSEVIAFEPNEICYAECINRTSDYPNIHVLNKGISDRQSKVSFRMDGGASHITDDGDSSIDLDTIDRVAANKKISFIKMDIEGEEERALNGASSVIKRDKPILAVSIYHKPSDIWRLPLAILNIYEEYNFYLRHYSMGWDDTVLYAVPSIN